MNISKDGYQAIVEDIISFIDEDVATISEAIHTCVELDDRVNVVAYIWDFLPDKVKQKLVIRDSEKLAKLQEMEDDDLFFTMELLKKASLEVPSRWEAENAES